MTWLGNRREGTRGGRARARERERKKESVSLTTVASCCVRLGGREGWMDGDVHEIRGALVVAQQEIIGLDVTVY